MNKDFLPDSVLPGKNSFVCRLDDGCHVRLDAVSSSMFRIRYSLSGDWCESGLNRYGFINDKTISDEIQLEISEDGTGHSISTGTCTVEISKDGALCMKAGDKSCTSSLPPEVNEGFSISFAMDEKERIYGLGDASRANIMRRGDIYDLYVVNVSSYIPIPVVFSSRGWGMLLNTTWRSTADVGKSNYSLMKLSAEKSPLDFYIFAADGLPALLDAYTSLAGRPKLLPIWGYALTYVANEKINAFEMMNEASKFRELGIPCDTMGLEPGWMSKHYDQTVEKKWDPDRFPMPWWAPVSPHTFPSALKRLGFKLSLWLCCDFDLTAYEEKKLQMESNASASAKNALYENQQGLEKDTNLDSKQENTKKEAEKTESENAEEYWFKHLEKFVDQGASAFKLDGAWQVMPHPDRIYANGMDDAQMHNLYPAIYDRQMSEGFEKHAGRRSMVYSASGYVGIQSSVASWAGDTGGGPRPLASMLNLGMSGHSNHSCDMDVFSAAGIHFGLLQTWAQLCNWAYWRQPWYLEPAGFEMYRFYAKLRYRLLPYIYTSAWQAHETGMPVMRAMPLAFPEMDKADDIMTQYMLGDFLLVTAFTENLFLPEGEWLDFWTGHRLQGPAELKAEYPSDRGGCLLIKSGAIIPTWPEMSHTTSGTSREIGLIVNPGDKVSEFTLYEDDGISLEHRSGAFATTAIRCNSSSLTVFPRTGSFREMPSERIVNVELHLRKLPNAILVNGNEIEFKASERKNDYCVKFSCKTSPDQETNVNWA